MPLAHHIRAPFVVALAASALVLACGGSTSEDAPASGGSGAGGSGGSGAGGSGGGAGTSVGGGGGNGGGCPSSLPSPNTSCSPEGLSCTFQMSQCCPPSFAKCENGQWNVAIAACAAPPPLPCPPSPPANGESCAVEDPCAGSYPTCTWGLCEDGSPQTTAYCDGATWKVTAMKCLPMPCEKLTACECFDRPDCQATSDSCICPCDYNCPGDPPCVCACGGGNYLGCKPAGG